MAHSQPQQAPTAPPATLFLFGASGDLVKRLLIPSLYSLSRAGLLDPSLRIVGIDVAPGDDDSFRQHLEDFLASQADDAEAGGVDLEQWPAFAQRLSYVEGDFTQASTYRRIDEIIQASDTGNALFYLATAPRFFGDIAERLGAAGLLDEGEARYRRVVIEKPFGHDLASAQALNARLLSVMEESQLYRIDHFLGKETVQNILIARFANVLFEPLWNNHYIDHVQITAAETVGVEKRGSFYDKNGALRDMVPNHLFQLMAMVAIEPPADFNADALRSEKSKLLGAIRPWSKDEARHNSVRGQYQAGHFRGQPAPGYRDEPDVDTDSTTETYTALKLMVDNWRWEGVPFYLRTGKRMSAQDKEIAICFKPAPCAPFRCSEAQRPESNYLIIQIQPDEGIWLDFEAKRPGPLMAMETIQLGFAYKDFFDLPSATGYETLIYDCLTGDQLLFQRADTIENGWRAVQPFLNAWQETPHVDGYAVGQDGPANADEFIKRDGRQWHRIGGEQGQGPL
ncbi:glucose-6-phosphate dehydrogenase [Modicisalibacter xianhensis]|uniref:Glucose-6-phosphate 1-dehydrogenase n=1 Tax=Modicisalibacter xianhensis TaxID=442341 RepID=A0A1I3DM30_9GAMM|nr:glucose-6-phosphate dehydrogenase [Halomonas xianhensis]SFH87733.1 glucose-6-phosphate 1-dehydrogenase [Halomonas xianhensis]